MVDLPMVDHGFMGKHPAGEGDATEAETPKLGRRIRAAKGLRKIIVGTLEHLTSNISPTLRGDAEGVHQIRIALRASRAALALFEPRLDCVIVRRLETELGDFGRLFGIARDWDVFCLETMPAAIVALPSERICDLQHAADVQRRLAHAAVLVALRGPHFSAAITRLAVWVEGCGLRNDLVGKHLTALAPSLLERVASKAKKRSHRAGKLSAKARHSLRKSIVKLWDDVKFFTRLFPGRKFERYRDKCEEVQTILGLANDYDVARRLALSLTTDRGQDLEEPANALIEWSKRRSRRALRRLDTALNELRALPAFWR